jgi:hypothetical protein
MCQMCPGLQEIFELDSCEDRLTNSVLVFMLLTLLSALSQIFYASCSHYSAYYVLCAVFIGELASFFHVLYSQYKYTKAALAVEESQKQIKQLREQLLKKE